MHKIGLIGELISSNMIIALMIILIVFKDIRECLLLFKRLTNLFFTRFVIGDKMKFGDGVKKLVIVGERQWIYTTLGNLLKEILN